MKRDKRFINLSIAAASFVVSLVTLGIAYSITIMDKGPTEDQINAKKLSQVNECMRFARSKDFDMEKEMDRIVFYKDHHRISGSYSELFAMQSIETYCSDMNIQSACIGEACAEDEEVQGALYQDAFFRFSVNTPAGLL